MKSIGNGRRVAAAGAAAAVAVVGLPSEPASAHDIWGAYRYTPGDICFQEQPQLRHPGSAGTTVDFNAWNGMHDGSCYWFVTTQPTQVYLTARLFRLPNGNGGGTQCGTWANYTALGSEATVWAGYGKPSNLCGSGYGYYVTALTKCVYKNNLLGPGGDYAVATNPNHSF